MFEFLKRKKREVISLDIYSLSCLGCGKCVDFCRRNVLQMTETESGRYAYVAAIENCVGCGKCVRKCDANAIKLETQPPR